MVPDTGAGSQGVGTRLAGGKQAHHFVSAVFFRIRSLRHGLVEVVKALQPTRSRSTVDLREPDKAPARPPKEPRRKGRSMLVLLSMDTIFKPTKSFLTDTCMIYKP